MSEDLEIEETYTLGYSSEVPSLTDAEREEMLEHIFEDPEDFCKTILPEKFPLKMPWVHKGLLAIITGRADWLLWKCDARELDKIVRHFTWKTDYDSETAPEYPIFKITLVEGNPTRIDMEVGKYTKLIMPRGFSKTTLMGIAGSLYKILFQEVKYLVYVSETARAAEQQLRNVRSELGGNPMIHMLFGNLQPKKQGEQRWTNDFFETTTGIYAAARGRGGQIRGMNEKGRRPDCIFFDDVEDKESVKTEDQREKTREWFYGDLMPALPPLDPKATIIGLGTLLHREALLMTLRRDPDWTSLTFSALDRDGEPLWADNMNMEKLEAKKASYALAGMLSTYYREYESLLRNAESSLFPGPFLHKPEWRGDLDVVSLAIDPAISKEEKSDFTGLAAVGQTTKGNYLILDILLEKGMEVESQVDKYFEFHNKWKPTKHGVETIAYQAALAQIIRGEMFKRKAYFTIENITHGKTQKDERIVGILRPLYANGMLAHLRPFPLYEAQLLDYPNGKKDGPDVVAQAIKLLNPYIHNMAGSAEEGGGDLEDDEYETLGNWQQY